MQIYDTNYDIHYDEVTTQKTYQMYMYDMIYEASLECNTSLDIMWYYRQKKQLMQRELLREKSKKCELEVLKLLNNNLIPTFSNGNNFIPNETTKYIRDNFINMYYNANYNSNGYKYINNEYGNGLINKKKNNSINKLSPKNKRNSSTNDKHNNLFNNKQNNKISNKNIDLQCLFLKSSNNNKYYKK